jgi:hypothetical protein
MEALGASSVSHQTKREEFAMTKIHTLLIGTAMSAFAASAAIAQTTQPMQPAAGVTTQAQAQGQTAGQIDVQGAQPVTPPPTRLTASGSADPLVQKRDADAQANAEYRASKKASKAELKEQQKSAKAAYKQQVRDAKINKKADKQTADNEMKMNMQSQAGQQADSGEDKH